MDENPGKKNTRAVIRRSMLQMQCRQDQELERVWAWLIRRCDEPDCKGRHNIVFAQQIVHGKAEHVRAECEDDLALTTLQCLAQLGYRALVLAKVDPDDPQALLDLMNG